MGVYLITMPQTIWLLIKNFLIDLFSEPEKIIKFILIFVFGPLLIFSLLFIIPTAIVVNVPAVLITFDNDADQEVIAKQSEIISIYKNVPDIIKNSNLSWIEEKKKEYSLSCNDINVINDFDLSWEQLIAIDSIRLEQNFDNVNKDDIIEIGKMFIIKDDYTETYDVEEEYEVEEEYIVTVVGPDGNEKQEKRKRNITKTRTVTKTRAIISITSKSFDEVIDEIGFDDLQKEVAKNILFNVSLGFNFDL